MAQGAQIRCAVGRKTSHMKQDNQRQRAGLRPPTFRLSSLLVVMAIICTTLALLRLLDPMWVGLFLFLLLIVSAHVAGNVLGTQLRNNARFAEPLNDDRPAAVPHRNERTDASLFAPSTRLSRRIRLGLSTFIVTGVGGLGGAIGGGWFLWWLLHGNVSIASITVGVVSCGVLGGLSFFVISSLLSVLGAAVWHAHQEPDD